MDGDEHLSAIPPENKITDRFADVKLGDRDLVPSCTGSFSRRFCWLELCFSARRRGFDPTPSIFFISAKGIASMSCSSPTREKDRTSCVHTILRVCQLLRDVIEVLECRAHSFHGEGHKQAKRSGLNSGSIVWLKRSKLSLLKPDIVPLSSNLREGNTPATAENVKQRN
jgi:hypothetical protein